MTYPIPNYTRVWVRGRMIDLGKAALQEDNYGLALPVTFSPSPKVLLNAGTGQIISTASFKITPAAQDGYFAIQLPATDDPDINPTNFTYAVKEPTGRSYNIIVPAATPLLDSPGDPLHGQPVLDLITIVPSPPAGAGSVQLLTGLPGRGIASVDNVAGDLVVTYTDSTTQNLGPVPAGAMSLAELTDVDTTGAAVGDLLAVSSVGPLGVGVGGAQTVSDLVTKPVVRLGLYADPGATAIVSEFTTTAAEQPSLILKFHSYVISAATIAAEVQAIHDAGQTAVVGWMPQDGSNVTTQPEYQLSDILAGTYDTYMTGVLTALRNLGFPVYLRWAHEMNGNWYNWSEGVNGNTTGQFASAWRHVHGLAAAVGANNIKWVWAPTDHFAGSTELAGLYPGDDYVDVLAVQGYNWGSTHATGWRNPSQVFDATITDLVKINPLLPLWISEMGCVPDAGGSKATWFTDFFEWLPTTTVSAFIYFEQGDARVGSSTGSAAAFTSGMGSLRQVTRAAGLDIRSQLAGPADIVKLNERLDVTPGSTSSLWSAGHAESISRLGTSEMGGTSGRLWLTYVTAPVTVTINTLAIVCGGTASAGATVARMAIFEVGADLGLTKIAQTENDTTIANGTYTDHQRALSPAGGFPGQITLTRGKRYAFGWLNVASTPASINGGSVVMGFLAPAVSKIINSQTDIQGSYADSSLSGWYTPIFMAGIHY